MNETNEQVSCCHMHNLGLGRYSFKSGALARSHCWLHHVHPLNLPVCTRLYNIAQLQCANNAQRVFILSEPPSPTIWVDVEAYSKHFCVVQYVDTLREDAARSHCSVQILKCTAALIENHQLLSQSSRVCPVCVIRLVQSLVNAHM